VRRVMRMRMERGMMMRSRVFGVLEVDEKMVQEVG
jgi:hypothetical protein